VIKSSDSTQTTFTRLIGYIETLKRLGKAILFNGNEVKWSIKQLHLLSHRFTKGAKK
jgi:hypothetical protein